MIKSLSNEAGGTPRAHHCFLTPHAVTIAFNSLTRSSSTSCVFSVRFVSLVRRCFC